MISTSKSTSLTFSFCLLHRLGIMSIYCFQLVLQEVILLDESTTCDMSMVRGVLVISWLFWVRKSCIISLKHSVLKRKDFIFDETKRRVFTGFKIKNYQHMCIHYCASYKPVFILVFPSFIRATIIGHKVEVDHFIVCSFMHSSSQTLSMLVEFTGFVSDLLFINPKKSNKRIFLSILFKLGVHNKRKVKTPYCHNDSLYK